MTDITEAHAAAVLDVPKDQLDHDYIDVSICYCIMLAVKGQVKLGKVDCAVSWRSRTAKLKVATANMPTTGSGLRDYGGPGG